MKKSSIFIILLGIIYFSPAHAGETLNNKKFIELSKGQRHWYFIGAYSAISHMTGMKDQKQSECILNWFFNQPEKQEAMLLENIRRYPDHSPTSIIFALLKRSCNILPKS